MRSSVFLRRAWLAVALVACAPAVEPTALPSPVAYRLDVFELAATCLPDGTTWGRPVAQPRLSEQEGGSLFLTQTWNGFATDEASAQALIGRLEPVLGEAIVARGGRIGSSLTNVESSDSHGSTLRIDYDRADVDGYVHVELRTGSAKGYELFCVIREETGSFSQG